MLELGPFQSAFERVGLDVPGYLELLNLNQDSRAGIAIVIDRIAQAMADVEAERYVAALMAEQNWRPHLVGAVAYLLDGSARLDRSLIWQAIDAGSWVTPQLVVAASERARARLDAHCASGKLSASLLALCRDCPELRDLEQAWRADPVIAEGLRADASWDRSEHIVGDWRSRICECFKERRIELVRAGDGG